MLGLVLRVKELILADEGLQNVLLVIPYLEGDLVDGYSMPWCWHIHLVEYAFVNETQLDAKRLDLRVWTREKSQSHLETGIYASLHS